MTPAAGEVHIKATLALRKALSLHSKEDTFPLGKEGWIGCALGWERTPGGKAVDVDCSCVAMDRRGQVLHEETVYFAKENSSDGSISHSGDEQV